MSGNHSNEFDERMKKYVDDVGFTPALFYATQTRHKEHIDRIEKKQDELSRVIGDAVINLSKDIRELSSKISSLPCDKHDGERKVLEQRVHTLETKPADDKKLIYIAMIGCGAVGGLIVSGVVKIGEIAKHITGL